jgi:hypothetical protein
MKGERFMLNKSVTRSLAVAAVLAAVLLTLSTRAFADLVGTTVGPIDRSCVHEVPSGATVDAETGSVTLNGASVAHYPPCAASGAPHQSQFSHSHGGSGGGSAWYEFSWANAVPIGGLTQFDYLEVQWTVPQPGPSDGTVIYLFPAFENFSGSNPSTCPFGSGCGSFSSIIQPVLQWGYNSYNGGHYWEAEGMEVWGNNVLFSNPCFVNSGDTVVGVLWQIQANPDKWEVVIEDTTNRCYTWNFFQPGSSWPKYNTAQGGVLEAYGNAAESILLTTCADLPTDNSSVFQILNIDEAGPAWNSFNPVKGNMTWQAFNNPFLFSPACNWSAAAGPGITWLTWQY